MASSSSSDNDDDFVKSYHSKKRKDRNDDEDDVFEKDNDHVKDDDDSEYESDDVPLNKLKTMKTTPSAKTTSIKKVTKKKVKKEVVTKTKKAVVTSKKKIVVKANSSKSTVRKLKVHGKAERLDMAIKAYRWWQDEELGENIAWRKLEHNGVLFPPTYLPHGIPLVYNQQVIILTPVQEEIASFYAAISKEGPQLNNPKTAKIFNANFFSDFKKTLGKGHVVSRFDLCDFSKIKDHLEEEKEKKKSSSKEEKAPEKEKKIEEGFAHGFAMLDGHLEKVGNFRIEPPGLFRGRGEHPKTGTLKARVMAEQVTINCGMGDRVPPCSTPGHAWKEVIHRDSVTWLAYWNENVMNNTKYVWLSASSSFKGKSDMEKYEKARRLKKCIDKIRKDYKNGLSSKDESTRQRSTAMWVIDILALRVGGEKNEDEADTVGCCSLRVEHMSFNELKKEACEFTLSFLGKDSMPYNNTVSLATYGDVGRQIYKNLKHFCKNKGDEAQVFSALSPTELNKHLGMLMPGLSAKVFRTYNASHTLQEELPNDLDITAEAGPKVLKYNEANRKVAILCNHQRTVPKSFDATMEKMAASLDVLTAQVNELKSMKGLLKKGKTVRIKLETDNMDEKKAQSHLFVKQPTVDQITTKLASFIKKEDILKIRVQDKEDNKEVALGTSKINYMDPRITVAWCKRNEVPISSVFAKTLREKFVWAMEASSDWTF